MTSSFSKKNLLKAIITSMLFAPNANAIFSCDDDELESSKVIQLANKIPNGIKKDSSGREVLTLSTGTGDHSFSEVSYFPKRDSKNRVVGLTAQSRIYSLNFSSDERPLSETNYTIGYTNEGNCYYKRIMKTYPDTSEKQLFYDEQLCNDLSNLLKKFSTELNKCNQIISEMSKTVEKFKKEMGSDKLRLTRVITVSNSLFQEAIGAASECAQLNETEKASSQATRAKAPKKPAGARR